MNSSKLFNVSRYLLRNFKYQHITSKSLIRQSSRFVLYAIVPTVTVPNVSKDDNASSHSVRVKTGLTQIENEFSGLIRVLENAIVATSAKYRHCLEMQIEMIEKGENIDADSDYWDQIVEYRVEADSLKAEFEGYKNMIEHVRQAAFSLGVCSSLIKHEEEQYTCGDFFKLDQICKDEDAENKRMEKLLLKIKMSRIAKEGESPKKQK